MGASDILKNTSQNELDNARLDRDSRTNPPEYQPGQEDDFGEEFFGGDSGGDGFGGGGGSFSGFDSGIGGGFGGGFGGQPTSQPQQKSTEDKVYEALGVGAKGFWGFSKGLVSSFGGLTPKFWSVWGTHSAMTGGGLALFGLVTRLFGLKSGTSFLVGGLLTSATGILVLMLNVESARECTSQYKDGGEPQTVVPSVGEPYNDFFDEDVEEGVYEGEEDDFDDFDSDGFDDALFNTPVVEEVPIPSSVSPTEALTQLQEIPKGMITRQYLYEAFTKVLPNVKPDYATVKSIDSSNDIFLAWEGYLRESAKLLGVQEDNLPDLLTLEETLFTIKLCVSRYKGLNTDKLAEEIARIYSYSDGTFDPAVYATADPVGGKCFITVFTGETALVSLKDIYANCKDFILDSKNYIPVVLGIDQSGKSIVFDFKKLESILVTGMPRSGKSWFVQAILTQMCAFLLPSELHFYICDPKEGMSDFKSFCLPHVKKFASKDDDILNTLRFLVNVEAPRRKAIMGSSTLNNGNGFVNIWDYKDVYPDADMPLIYILIDEVITLAERMDKDTKDEFQGLLLQLISQLPMAGIRAFLIPHMVKNDILKKTMTDMIPCRVSVFGDAGHIEGSLGVKPKDFKYKLSNVGDMAIKMPLLSPVPFFTHGVALTPSNPGNSELFDYLRRVWNKLEPESTKGSVASVAEELASQRELLKMVDDDKLEEPVFVESTDGSGLFGLELGEVKSGVRDKVQETKVSYEDDEFNCDFDGSFGEEYEIDDSLLK